MNEFVLRNKLKMESFSFISILGLIHESHFYVFQVYDSLRVALKSTEIALLDADKLFWWRKPEKPNR